jgi:hypothetical protein
MSRKLRRKRGEDGGIGEEGIWEIGIAMDIMGRDMGVRRGKTTDEGMDRKRGREVGDVAMALVDVADRDLVMSIEIGPARTVTTGQNLNTDTQGLAAARENQYVIPSPRVLPTKTTMSSS